MQKSRRIREIAEVKGILVSYTKLIDGESTVFTYTSGTRCWYLNGTVWYHRIDGPAVEMANGDKQWHQNGKLHRLDGPAVDHVYGYKEWWVEGNNIDCKTQEEFERLMRLKAFW